MQVKVVKGTIEIDKVVPFFQPVLDIHTGSVVNYECLARLVMDNQHICTPAEFLYLVHREKFSSDLTRIMFSKCAEYFRQQTVEWSLNLSEQDIQDQHLQYFLVEYLRHYPDPHRVVFEILGSEVQRHPEALKEFLLLCKALDTKVYIDRFGRDNTNIIALFKLPIDGIKLDGTLTKQLLVDADSRLFVEHICDLADAANIDVIAEFVEEKALIDVIKSLGIKYAQGFYLQEPSPIAEH